MARNQGQSQSPGATTQSHTARGHLVPRAGSPPGPSGKISVSGKLTITPCSLEELEPTAAESKEISQPCCTGREQANPGTRAVLSPGLWLGGGGGGQERGAELGAVGSKS